MSNAENHLPSLLRNLNPMWNEGVYVFATVPEGMVLNTLSVLATFREQEGMTVIAEEKVAKQANLPILFRAAWITLQVVSDLEAVGLTAAVASALQEANISCNVVAAANHDHIFVPVESAEAAMAQLHDLQHRALDLDR